MGFGMFGNSDRLEFCDATASAAKAGREPRRWVAVPAMTR